MKRSTIVIGSSAGFLAAVAFSGLIGGASLRASASSGSGQARTAAVQAGTSAHALLLDQACKGQNTCSGKGGCKTGDQGCKGKNTCAGKGGCKVPATQP